MSKGSNQIFANSENLYTQSGGIEVAELKTTFVNAANIADVSAEYTIKFSKSGNTVCVEFPLVEILTGLTTNTQIYSTGFAPVGFRPKGQVKLPVIIKTNFLPYAGSGYCEIDANDGRIHIFIVGTSFTVSSGCGMEPTDLTYASDLF